MWFGWWFLASGLISLYQLVARVNYKVRAVGGGQVVNLILNTYLVSGFGFQSLLLPYPDAQFSADTYFVPKEVRLTWAMYLIFNCVQSFSFCTNVYTLVVGNKGAGKEKAESKAKYSSLLRY